MEYSPQVNSSYSINIIYDFRDRPWGGGNQFLTLLKGEFAKNGLYQEDVNKAEVVLFNSYQNLLEAIKLRIKQPDKFIVFRLGPIFHYHRGQYWQIIDKLVVEAANRIADLVIFQSKWSLSEAVKLGFDKSKNFSIIGNATVMVDVGIKKRPKDKKTRLFSDSWSSNWKKGFAFYKYLDDNLDFDRYEMTFVGNSPISFKNIKQLSPLPSKELFKELSKNDIFVTATEDDACSNSIIEALSCGLPVVALNSGGNAEIIGRGGELFNSEKEMLGKINKVKEGLLKYRRNIQVKTIEEIGNKYEQAIKKHFYNRIPNVNQHGALSLFLLKARIQFLLVNILSKIDNIKHAN